MKKILISALIIFIVIGAIASLGAWVTLSIKNLIDIALTKTIGAEVIIDNLFLNSKENALYIKDFKVYNPEGFDRKEVLAYAPQIKGEYNLNTLIKNKKLHFTKLEIFMKMLAVIKNKDGTLNVNELRIADKNWDLIPLQVDNLILTVEYVGYKDLTKGEKPQIQVYNVDIKEKTYSDIPSAEEIAKKIISETISQTTIKGVTVCGVGILAASALGGPVGLSAGALVAISGKDSYKKTLDADYNTAYETSLEVAKEYGKNIYQSKEKGLIKGSIDGAKVTISVKKEEEAKTQVSVTARGYLLPKPNVAGGILLEIFQKLNPKQ